MGMFGVNVCYSRVLAKTGNVKQGQQIFLDLNLDLILKRLLSMVTFYSFHLTHENDYYFLVKGLTEYQLTKRIWSSHFVLSIQYTLTHKANKAKPSFV